MTTPELVAIATSLIPPVNATRACVTVEHTPGRKLPTGQPAGDGSTTRYRAAFTDGLRTFPVGPLFERQKDALRLVEILS